MSHNSDDVIDLGSSEDEQETQPAAPKTVRKRPPPDVMVSIPGNVLNPMALKKRKTDAVLKKGKPGHVHPGSKVGCSRITEDSRFTPKANQPNVPKKVALPIISSVFSQFGKVPNVRQVPAGPVLKVAKEGAFAKACTISKINSMPNISITKQKQVNRKVNEPTAVRVHKKNMRLVANSNALMTNKPSSCYNGHNINLSKLPSGLVVRKTTTVKNVKTQHQNVNNALCGKLAAQKRVVTSIRTVTQMKAAMQIKSVNQMRSAPQVKETLKTYSKAQVINRQNPIAQKRFYPTGEVLPVEIDIPPINPAEKLQWYMAPDVNLNKQNENESEPSNTIEILIEDSPAKPQKHMIEIEVASTPEKPANKPAQKLLGEITIEDSPAKPEDVTKNLPEPTKVTPQAEPHSKKKLEFPKKIEEDVENKSEPKEEITEEFHPVFHKFIDLCLEMENSADMQKIVDKKIKGYCRQVDKSFSHSPTFLHLVAEKINSIRNDSENMFLYIKDVVDELKMQKRVTKVVEQENTAGNEANRPSDCQADEVSAGESRHDSNIRKLEKTLLKVHRTIQKLEEQEVDLDDECDSVYLLTEKYKARAIRLHKKLNQLQGSKLPTEARVKLEPAPGKPPGPYQRLEKWINRKVPVGAPLPFPDFHDVLKCVKDANTEDKLGWSETVVMAEAREMFTRCGKRLQRRRQQNEWRTASVWLKSEQDPADIDQQLKFKLEENKRQSVVKEKLLIDKFAEKQHQLNLEGEEVKEDEIDKSENDDEDDIICLEEENAIFIPQLIKEEKSEKEDCKLVNGSDITVDMPDNLQVSIEATKSIDQKEEHKFVQTEKSQDEKALEAVRKLDSGNQKLQESVKCTSSVANVESQSCLSIPENESKLNEDSDSLMAFEISPLKNPEKFLSNKFVENEDLFASIDEMCEIRKSNDAPPCDSGVSQYNTNKSISKEKEDLCYIKTGQSDKITSEIVTEEKEDCDKIKKVTSEIILEESDSQTEKLSDDDVVVADKELHKDSAARSPNPKVNTEIIIEESDSQNIKSSNEDIMVEKKKELDKVSSVRSPHKKGNTEIVIEESDSQNEKISSDDMLVENKNISFSTEASNDSSPSDSSDGEQSRQSTDSRSNQLEESDTDNSSVEVICMDTSSEDESSKISSASLGTIKHNGDVEMKTVTEEVEIRNVITDSQGIDIGETMIDPDILESEHPTETNITT